MTSDAGRESNIQHNDMASPERFDDSGEELPRVLRCLFEEHRHLNALVCALERKAKQRGVIKASDYYLLRDIVGYLNDYPDSVHHPTENLMFELLLQREPSRRKSVAGLRRDHESVATETENLLELLDQAIDAPSVPLEKSVRQACLAFVEHQKKHMQFENQKLFPAAMDALSQEDWNRIESHFAKVADPLFGGIVGNTHRLLYEYLVESEGEVAQKFSISRLVSLERLIMAVDVLEKGADTLCTRLGDLGDELSEETRRSLAKSVRPENLFSVFRLPVDYAWFLGRSLLVYSGEATRICSNTARDTLALYTRRDPVK